MDCQPLTAAEQYAFTSGLCHVFAEAIHPIVGGIPTILVSQDPRVAAKHDWPPDEILPLHVFLTLADGSVVDAEGRRSLTALLRGFGVAKGYKHELICDPEFVESHRNFGQTDTPGSHPWKTVIGARIIDLGWGQGSAPEALCCLNGKARFRQAREAWENQEWPNYQQKFAQVKAQSDKVAKKRRRGP